MEEMRNEAAPQDLTGLSIESAMGIAARDFLCSGMAALLHTASEVGRGGVGRDDINVILERARRVWGLACQVISRIARLARTRLCEPKLIGALAPGANIGRQRAPNAPPAAAMSRNTSGSCVGRLPSFSDPVHRLCRKGPNDNGWKNAKSFSDDQFQWIVFSATIGIFIICL